MWDLLWTILQSYRPFFPLVLIPSPVHIIPPTLHTHLYLHVALTRRTNGRSLGNFLKQCFFFGNLWALDRKKLPICFFFSLQICSTESRFWRTLAFSYNFLTLLLFRIHTSLYQDKWASNKKLLSRWPSCVPPETTCVSHIQQSSSRSSPLLFLFNP